MKKNIFFFTSFIASSLTLIALETPQTPEVSSETQQIKKTVDALKTESTLGQKLLGRDISNLKKLAQEIKENLSTIKAQVTNEELKKLVDDTYNQAVKINDEIAKQ